MINQLTARNWPLKGGAITSVVSTTSWKQLPESAKIQALASAKQIRISSALFYKMRPSLSNTLQYMSLLRRIGFWIADLMSERTTAEMSTARQEEDSLDHSLKTPLAASFSSAARSYAC